MVVMCPTTHEGYGNKLWRVHMVTVLEVNRIVHTVVELNNKYDCGTGMEAINIMIVMELKSCILSLVYH